MWSNFPEFKTNGAIPFCCFHCLRGCYSAPGYYWWMHWPKGLLHLWIGNVWQLWTDAVEISSNGRQQSRVPSNLVGRLTWHQDLTISTNWRIKYCNCSCGKSTIELQQLLLGSDPNNWSYMTLVGIELLTQDSIRAMQVVSCWTADAGTDVSLRFVPSRSHSAVALNSRAYMNPRQNNWLSIVFQTDITLVTSDMIN